MEVLIPFIHDRNGLMSVVLCSSFLRALSSKLQELKDKIQTAVVDRVVEDFVDITTPLKQFTDAALALEGKLKSN